MHALNKIVDESCLPAPYCCPVSLFYLISPLNHVNDIIQTFVRNLVPSLEWSMLAPSWVLATTCISELTLFRQSSPFAAVY